MKKPILFFALALTLVAARAQAGVRVGVSLGWPIFDRDDGRYAQRGSAYYEQPYSRYYGRPYPRYYAPYRPVIVEPVVYQPAPYVVTQPVYQQPVYQEPVTYAPPPSTLPATGDYGTDIGALNAKMAQERAILDRQVKKGGVTQAQYDDEMNALESIEHDEHARTVDNGSLSAADLEDLSRRLDNVRQNIDVDLAQ